MKRLVWAIAMGTAFALTGDPVYAAVPTTADCLTATESSVTLGDAHKLRAERAQLLTCAAASCPADIRKDCVSRAEEVSRQIPTIIFGAKDASGVDLNAVKVTMDGEELAERLEGTALFIDPGEHSFVFETTGQPPVTKKFTIQQAQKDRREWIVFGAPAPVPEIPPRLDVQNSEHEPPAAPSGATGRRTVAWAVGGVGLASLAAGVAFVAIASGKRSDCSGSGGGCQTLPDLNNYNSGTTLLNTGYGLLIAGGAMTAAGFVLWITSPRGSSGHGAQGHHEQTIRVGLAPNGIVLSGGFQ
jgi:hypothetical protein